TGHEQMPAFTLINMNGRIYDPLLGRMLSPDPYVAGGTQGHNRYSYCLNNPLKYTDPSGEWINIVLGAVIGGVSGYMMADAAGVKGKGWYALAGATIGAVSGGVGSLITSSGGSALAAGAASGAVAGAGYGGMSAKASGGNVGTGILYGGILGGVTGLLSAWAPFGTTWYGNTAYGALLGAGAGAANAAINEQNVGSGALWGGIIGGVVGFATSENTINAIRGQGFRSNDAVLSRFVASNNQQGAVDYFGFQGTYDPSPQNVDYVESNRYFGKTDPSTAQISYGDLAFSSYHTLKSTYYKEMYHYNRFVRGIPPAKYYSDFPNYDPNVLYAPEERLGFIHQYKNHGLYRSYTGNPLSQIKYYGVNGGGLTFKTHMFDFIYKIPRRW
ncbi:MAG: hypothetical protein JSS64_02375, partial [Bacteroidetes bacterium]|nr:hypothetical protein [Bacteroidota bacterium]